MPIGYNLKSIAKPESKQYMTYQKDQIYQVFFNLQSYIPKDGYISIILPREEVRLEKNPFVIDSNDLWDAA